MGGLPQIHHQQPDNSAISAIAVHTVKFSVDTGSDISVVVNSQVLDGAKVHDDAATHSSHYDKRKFVGLKQRVGSTLTGADGQAPEAPWMGSTIENGEILKSVVYLPKINYCIHSQYQLIEVEKWTTKGWTELSVTYERYQSGRYEQRVYARKRHETHKILIQNNLEILVIDIHDTKYQPVIKKMSIEHENTGHEHPKSMLKACDIYSPSKLNYTKEEALIYLKYWEECDGAACDGCFHGRTVRRFKDSKGKVVYIERIRYGSKDGLHMDAFYISDDYVLLTAKSHKLKMFWTLDTGKDYGSKTIQNALEEIFGDYRYTGSEIHFVRCDMDPKFVPLQGWLNLIGLRFFVSPKATKTSQAERGIRTIKELMRVIHESIGYQMPKQWIPLLVAECTFTMTLRVHSKLGKTPYEAFFSQEISFKEISAYKFGNVVAYSSAVTL